MAEFISKFLTPETEKYYNEIVEIVKHLEEVSGATKVVIFGGFIRSLIAGEGIPRDVDLWFIYQNAKSITTPGIWRRRIQEMLCKINPEKFNVHVEQLSTVHDISMKGEDKYEIATVKINGVDFDLCCNTSGRLSFDTLTDFTVNNLFMSMDGQLHTRVKTPFTVAETIKQIQDRKLICMDSSVPQFYKKEEKMIQYGYNY